MAELFLTYLYWFSGETRGKYASEFGIIECRQIGMENTVVDKRIFPALNPILTQGVQELNSDRSGGAGEALQKGNNGRLSQQPLGTLLEFPHARQRLY